MLTREYELPKERYEKSNYRFFVLAADVGGTNAYFGILGVRDNKRYDMIIKEKTETRNITVVHELINEVLRKAHEEYNIEVSRGCVSAAGPVSRKRGHIDMTNVDLQIKRGDILNQTLLKKVILINDFEAIGYGLDHLHLDLEKETTEMPRSGTDSQKGRVFTSTCAVLGAGTGLGMSIAYYDVANHLHTPLPSEGGHMDFAAYDKTEQALIDFLKLKAIKKKGVHPELERVVSGNGIKLIYEFMKTQKGFKATPDTKRIDKLKGNAQLEAIDAGYMKDKTCTATIDLFVKLYARAAKNIALVSECYGGLFLAGRITVKNKKALLKGEFIREFENHDRESALLRKIPVFIINTTDVSLYGCCNVLTNFYNLT